MNYDQSHTVMHPAFKEDETFAYWECYPCGYRYGIEDDRVNSVVISSN